MIIAIPTNGTAMDPLFGNSMVFDIADVNFETKNIDSLKTVNLNNPAGALALPQSLLEQGVQVVVCGQISRQTVEDLYSYGIEVLAGAPSAPSTDLLNALIEGAVVESGCGCGSGGCGCESGQGHGESETGGCGCGSDCDCHEDESDDAENSGGGCGCGSGCGCH